jgi:hypothetical protein
MASTTVKKAASKSAVAGATKKKAKRAKEKIPDSKQLLHPSEALKAYAGNLRRLMGGLSEEMWLKEAVSRNPNIQFAAKTLRRHIDLENEPELDKVEEVAKVFGLQAWQMLVPGVHAEKVRLKPAEVVTADV